MALRRPDPLSPNTAKDTSPAVSVQARGSRVTSGGLPEMKSSRQRTRFQREASGVVGLGGGEAGDAELGRRLRRLLGRLAAVGDREGSCDLHRRLERQALPV